MITQFHNRRFYIVLTADLLIFVTAFIGAYLLRFDFTLNNFYRGQMLRLLPFLLPGKILIFFLLGMYRGMWRYTGLNDLWRLVQASLLAILFYVAAAFYIFGFRGIPRSVFLLDAMLTFLLCGGLRMSIRLFYAATQPQGLLPSIFSKANNLQPLEKSVIIIGAGGAGEKMLREIIDNPHMDYHVVGFLDDDRAKWGRSLHGLKVLGLVNN
jgi:FlaA1/EpsC-like NDP-sugar epimerase